MRPFYMGFEIDKDVALLYGIMLGDGCLSLVYEKKKFIVITGSSKDDLPFFENVVHPLLKKFRGKNTNIKFRKDCNAIDFNFIDSKLFDFIHSFGFPIGKKGTEISIPDVFYEKDLLKYVVQGFMATDGSLVLTKNPNKYYPRIESMAICKNVLRQIYDYLCSIGMNGAFYLAKSKPYYKWKNVQIRYRFQFNGKRNLLIFNEKVDFVNPKMLEKFNEFTKYDKEYDLEIRTVPTQKVNFVNEGINKRFEERMARGRIELPTSCS